MMYRCSHLPPAVSVQCTIAHITTILMMIYLFLSARLADLPGSYVSRTGLGPRFWRRGWPGGSVQSKRQTFDSSLSCERQSHLRVSLVFGCLLGKWWQLHRYRQQLPRPGGVLRPITSRIEILSRARFRARSLSANG